MIVKNAMLFIILILFSNTGSDTSYFQLKHTDSRWWLQSGQHDRFVALGVVHVGQLYRGGASLIRKRFGGDVEATNSYVLKLLEQMNCNSIGYGAPNELKPHIPYFAHFNALMISEWRLGSGKLKYGDIFDPEVEQEMRSGMRQVCKENRDNPNLIGYYWTDMPMWDLDHADRVMDHNWVHFIRSLPESAPGKAAYVDYLLKRYTGRLDAMATRYEVEPERQVMLKEVFNENKRLDPVRREDDLAFLRLIARRYYSILGSETRKHDPHHLIFGDRYTNFVHPDVVLEEALPWIDVLSIQPNGKFNKTYFDALYAKTGKPINICDHQVSFPVPGFNKVIWPPVDSPEIAIDQMNSFVRDAFEQPYIVGYGRCQMIDYISHGNRIKIGLIDIGGNPKPDLCDPLSKAFRDVQCKLKLTTVK